MNEKEKRALAEKTLTNLDHVWERAKAEFQRRPNNPPDTDNAEIIRIFGEMTLDIKRLIEEPAICQVATKDEQGRTATYLICRGTAAVTPGNGANFKLASRFSPIGRLAPLPMGETLEINGLEYKVTERIVLDASRYDIIRDSINNKVDFFNFKTFIASLRSILPVSGGGYDGGGSKRSNVDLGGYIDDGDVFEDLIKDIKYTDVGDLEDRDETAHTSGTADTGGLPDQPVLDLMQDEVARLPLDSGLLITGPPGTGKTSTLIWRLAQKVNTVAGLTPEERELALRAERQSGLRHPENWLMFSPTETLRLYVKEAFNKNHIPAPDHNITTWSRYRRDLARNHFGIIRAHAGDRGFILEEDETSALAEGALQKTDAWYEDFSAWQLNEYRQDMLQAAKAISRIAQPQLINFAEDAAGIAAQERHTHAVAGLLRDLDRQKSHASRLIQAIERRSEEIISRSLQRHLMDNPNFLNNMAEFVRDEARNPMADTEDEDDEQDDKVNAANGQILSPEDIFKKYREAGLKYAEARITNVEIDPETKIGRLIEWLGDRTIADEDVRPIGQRAHLLRYLRKFSNPIAAFFNGQSARYKRYRRQNTQWYINDRLKDNIINGLELDLLLLSIMDNCRNLMCGTNRPASVWRFSASLFKTQIMADEATDFSPAQLKCMACLSNPTINSFFAAGDFNQRLTTWGTSGMESLKWAVPKIEAYDFSVDYRQTGRLGRLVKALGNPAENPEPVTDDEGPVPVLLENQPGRSQVVDWLVDRMEEIQRHYIRKRHYIRRGIQTFPSTAVFVNEEDDIRPLVAELAPALNRRTNLKVQGCYDGQNIGHDSSVRVFAVQHIKGLEFKAVFYLGVDRLMEKHPSLYEKYLYVGASRAAEFLGLACETPLSGRLSELRSLFGDSWAPR